MSAEIRNKCYSKTIQHRVGKLYKVRRNGQDHILLGTYHGYMSLTNPDVFLMKVDIIFGDELPLGTRISYTSEV